MENVTLSTLASTVTGCYTGVCNYVSSFFQPWPPAREFKEQALLNEEIKELNALVLSMNEERIFIVKK
ncbi:hypothetical protein [Legionella sp. km772]|uniref:hypothetical protein n=1 Tax=Legionella sp. km772 TaxID=2498111 RepID=UPI000F8CEDEB|nr:hypothetical protein [Legionella sp. km772]RUR04576.1 hypothetical protein ELY15_15340 [Legionella sp. km772]